MVCCTRTLTQPPQLAAVRRACVCRAGVDSPAQAAALAKRVAQLQASSNGAVALGGIQAYHGGLQHVRDPRARANAVAHVAAAAADAVAAVRDATGLGCRVVTGGGSGTYRLEAGSGVFTEVQPGGSQGRGPGLRKARLVRLHARVHCVHAGQRGHAMHLLLCNSCQRRCQRRCSAADVAASGSFVFGDADYARNIQPDGRLGEWEQSLWVLTQVRAALRQQGGAGCGASAPEWCADQQHAHKPCAVLGQPALPS